MHSVRRNGMEHIGSRLIHDISSRSHQPFEKFALLVPDEASPLAPEIKPEIAVTFEDPSIKCDVAAKRNLRIAQKTRSEEHTSELQSLMRHSYAVFCLKKKKQTITGEYNKKIIKQRHKIKHN